MRIPSFRQGTLGTLLFAAAFFSMILGNILFLTAVWGYSVLSAGLAVVPGPLTSAIIAGPAGVLADRFGHRSVIVPGTLAYAAGLLVLRSAGLEPDYVGSLAAGPGPGRDRDRPRLPDARRRGRGRHPGRALRRRERDHRRRPPARRRARHGDADRDRRRPTSLAEAARAADDAYLFGIGAALLAGAVALTLQRVNVPAKEALMVPA